MREDHAPYRPGRAERRCGNLDPRGGSAPAAPLARLPRRYLEREEAWDRPRPGSHVSLKPSLRSHRRLRTGSSTRGVPVKGPKARAHARLALDGSGGSAQARIRRRWVCRDGGPISVVNPSCPRRCEYQTQHPPPRRAGFTPPFLLRKGTGSGTRSRTKRHGRISPPCLFEFCQNLKLRTLRPRIPPQVPLPPVSAWCRASAGRGRSS